MESEMQFIRQDLMKLRRDMEIIKNILMVRMKNEDDHEGDLTDWAKDELEKA